MNYRVEKAYAKINLYLDVVKKNPLNGFHDIVTIMQTISLYDEVYLRPNDSIKGINLLCDKELGIDPKDNLAYRAAQLFFKEMNFDESKGIDIVIVKNIPVAAGLGGGSADAAAVLRGLNYFYNRPFTNSKLCEMAMEIGSDVPFCVLGGGQICTGRGKPELYIQGIHDYNLVVACGGEKLSTQDQYRQLDELFDDFLGYRCAIGYADTLSGYQSGRCRDAFAASKNIFESLYDENSMMQKIKDTMYENGAYFVQLSGSGPSLYGVFPDQLYAEDAMEALKAINVDSIKCLPINVQYDDIENGCKIW